MFYLARKEALSVIDRDTELQVAKFLPHESAGSVWQAILQCWILVFVGPPDSLRHDASSNFMSKEFQKTAGESGIVCHPVAVESAYFTGLGERYHGDVRRVYNRVAEDHRDLDSDLILAVAVKAINDTSGIDGLVPTLLCFNAIPKLPFPGIKDGVVPQAQRLAAMTLARDEYAAIIDKQRLQIIEEAQQPTTSTNLTYGENFCVHRHITKTWDGPSETALNKRAYTASSSRLGVMLI